jgi:hypothetical protein
VIVFEPLECHARMLLEIDNICYPQFLEDQRNIPVVEVSLVSFAANGC